MQRVLVRSPQSRSGQPEPWMTCLQGATQWWPAAVGHGCTHGVGMAAVRRQNHRALNAMKTMGDQLAPEVVVLPATFDMAVPFSYNTLTVPSKR